ncbi:DUF2225 domain-containing protein [Alkalihalobacillus deserti]|uniref:DUF2225 domain-containing protein n=1 Tax=Alkalihalobacillus deserti TaxID=2879466 RepID=UPI001D15524B|nr:DUF2225 domain-containing protein [Alkalihalobacillus deserti]
MTNQLSPLYDKKVLCLYCKNTFHSKRVRSSFIRIKTIDSDFCKVYKEEMINPLFYETDVCPDCGFASTEAFSLEFPNGAKDEIAKQFENWKTQEFGKERTVSDAIKAMKLAILSANLKRENRIVIGGLCLRLAWIYRSIEDYNQERRFLLAAYLDYEVSYERGDYIGTKMTELRLLYLLGELARRIEKREKAGLYFTRVIQHKKRATETKIVEMAREQWYIMRNQEQVNPTK